MRTFFRDMLATFWLLIWLLAGVYVMIQLLTWMDGERWQMLLSTTLSQFERIDSLETAVRIIGTLFAATWGIRLFDRFPFIRGAFINRLGFKPGAPNLFQLLTFSFVHGDDRHLFGNTRNLLIFGGVMAMLVPSLQAFLIGTLVVLLIAGVGFLIYSAKNTNQIGASCVLMGYYSFNVIYGLFAMGIGGTITAWLLILLFGPKTVRILRQRTDGALHVGHLSGFIGGIFSAAALVRMGYV